MTALSISPQDQAAAITSAANKYGVPYPVLVGIYGVETDYGRLVDTSSAGAAGAFQFIPSTAAGYGYPMTNNPTLAQFQQQANAAAHLLASSHHGGSANTNWNDAVLSYNPGGGQGYVDAVGKAMKNAPAALAKALGSAFQTSQTGASVVNIPNPLKGVEAIAALITSSAFWIRLGEALAGIILMAMGLRALTGASAGGAPMPVARAARKVARG